MHACRFFLFSCKVHIKQSQFQKKKGPYHACMPSQISCTVTTLHVPCDFIVTLLMDIIMNSIHAWSYHSMHLYTVNNGPLDQRQLWIFFNQQGKQLKHLNLVPFFLLLYGNIISECNSTTWIWQAKQDHFFSRKK
jgi:hypothetical protein